MDQIAPALKVVALCLPAVMISLIGLALSRGQGRRGTVAAKPGAPAPVAVRRSGEG